MNILTFDIEEWALAKVGGFGTSEKYAEYDSYLNQILDALDERGFKGTFFCTGHMAKYFPSVVKLIQRRGHEIGCHSNCHTWMNKMTEAQAREDTHIAMESLEQCTGGKILSYRAPAFSVGSSNKWMFEILAENGVKRDSSVYPAARDIGGFSGFGTKEPCNVEIEGVRIKEFPISLTKILNHEIAFAGGGYFRLLPLFFVKRVIKKSDYSICYFHIEDLLQERWGLLSREEYESYYKEKGSLKNRYVRYIKTNLGKEKAFEKLIQLLSSNSFVNLDMADKMINWENSPSVLL